MARLAERDWRNLLERIKDGKCTPFLGAGASFGAIPLGGALAEEWARQEGYPLADKNDLAKVAQFIAVMNDAMTPKERIQKHFATLGPPNFAEPDEPHSVLAELPLPVYVTTNYDDFMMRALRSSNRDAHVESCAWNTFLREQHPPTDDSAPAPTVAAPLVYHLHGRYQVPESLVLTEDDYLDFLVGISKNAALVPARVRRAFAGTSLLFMGYRLADTNFRVLFRMLVEYIEKSLARSHVSVQLSPAAGMSEAEKENVEAYLDKYFGKSNIHVYWGDCRSFVAELRARWRSFSGGAPA